MLNVTALEAACSGVPMIVAGGGATEEYLPKTAIRLEKSDVFVGPPLNTRYRVFDAEEIADKILVARLHGKRREKPSEKIREICKIETIMNEWRSVLN